MQQDLGSFRDKSGYVYSESDKIIRTIMPCYQDTWQRMAQKGFLEDLIDQELIIPFEECPPIPDSWKTLEVKTIPFITYPYEWSFSQLKDAALQTLTLQRKALEKSMVLKDASAYNVQFIGAKPVFIDLLSFEFRKEGKAWEAYRQFCSHFLAPLVLAAKKDLRYLQLSKQWIDGIPLDIASGMLPWKTKFSPGVLMHLVLHAAFQNRYADPRTIKNSKHKGSITKEKLLDITDSLYCTTEKLRFPSQSTEWGDYYTDTNYTDEATKAKLDIVKSVATHHGGKLAVDLGANTGRFSQPLAEHFTTVIAADVDPTAVDNHYRHLQKHGPHNILPIVLDLSSPSPSLGWASQERTSFAGRCKCDMLLALALCHHLHFTCGIPFAQISQFFASLIRPDGVLVVEFVPREDSQVQRMLCARDDIFDDYTLEEFSNAFQSTGFKELQRHSLPNSERTILVLQRMK